MLKFNGIDQTEFEDTYTLDKLEKLFFNKRGWTSKIPRKNSSVILVLSGGVDSVCLWNMLMEKYGLNVYPIYFIDKNTKKENKELISVRFFSKLFKEKYPTLWHEVFIKNYSFSFSFYSLRKYKNVNVDLSTIFSNLLFLPEQKTNIPSIIETPSRLGIYSFGAFEYAHFLRALKNRHVDTILFGLIPEDSMTVRESTLSVLKSINLSLCLILGDFNWQILAPFDKKMKFYFTKKDLIKHAITTGLPVSKTWSCMKDNPYHCGVCFSCVSRKDAFYQLNYPDSTIYKQKIKKKQFAQKIMKSLVRFFKNSTKIKNVSIRQYSKINLKSKISITKHTSWHENKRKLYIMNQKNSNIDCLNSAGAFIWKEIVSEKFTINNLILKMTSNYKVDKAKATRDLKILLMELQKRGYINIEK